MQTKLLINGELVAGLGAAQPVLNPSLGSTLVQIPEASAEQIDAAVRAADAAFDAWSQTTPGQRSALLLALADALMIRSWTMRLEAIRAAGQMGNEEFQMLHHRTTQAYTVAAGLLLAAGIGLIVTAPALPRRVSETAPA